MQLLKWGNDEGKESVFYKRGFACVHACLCRCV